MTDTAQRTTHHDTVDSFNAACPIGTPVLAFPGSRDGRALMTTTRSTAWLVGPEPVVMVEHYAGGIALTHIEIMAPASPSCGCPPEEPCTIEEDYAALTADESDTRAPDDPPGIDPQTSDLPDADDARTRVIAFLRWFGDGRVQPDTEEPGPPLYARDLEVLTRGLTPADIAAIAQVSAARGAGDEPEAEVTTLRVTVTVDTDELRKWADWHADRDHHGVAHVLYKAATDGESLSDQSTREARANAWDEGVTYLAGALGKTANQWLLDNNPHRGGSGATTEPSSEEDEG
jgi:hypothetical protein